MTGIGRFFKGTGYLFRGASTLLTGRGLWRWALLPLIINFVLFAAVGAFGVWAAFHYTGGAAGESWWATLLALLAAALTLAAYFLVGFFTFGLVANLLASPFNELLSQGTERLLTGATGEIKDRVLAAEMLRAALAALKLFALEMAITVPALLALLIPVVGPVLLALLGGFFLALAFLDYPLDRRKLGVKQKLAFCRRHRAEAMGFGLTVYAAMLVPFLNVLMIPAAAVGATRLYLDLSASEGPAPSSGEASDSPPSPAPSGS